MKKLSLIYTNAKIFVLCSKEEPFGIVPIEAMSSETVVIADNSGGPKEIIDNGENGILINNMDKTRLATCIDNVLSNTRKATSLAKNARIKVVQNFTWEKSSSNLEQYL